ncbi:MAG: hypothetical protein WC067_05025 [Candidatus Methanomethylophilaceae archaeon]
MSEKDQEKLLTAIVVAIVVVFIAGFITAIYCWNENIISTDTVYIIGTGLSVSMTTLVIIYGACVMEWNNSESRKKKYERFLEEKRRNER